MPRHGRGGVVTVAVEPDLVDRATFIFKGTVLSTGQSSVRILEGRPGLAIARFDQAFRVNPMLGDLTGHRITVGTPPGSELRKGEQLIFFANSWVHSEAIAVSLIAQVPADARTEVEIERALKALPALYLERRVASAGAIVQGTVERVARANIDQPISEHAADWMRAEIKVQTVLKGPAAKEDDGPSAQAREDAGLEVFFPADKDDRWQTWPKLSKGQRGIFLMHRPPLGPLPGSAWSVPDPDDVQPVSAAKTIKKLIGDGQEG
jgi:hypothetical protein